MDPSESPDLCSPHHPMRLWVIAVNISWHNLALLIFFFFLLLVLLRETIVESWGWASSPWCANHPYHHGILSVKHVNTTGYVNFLFRLSTSLCFCCQVIFFFFFGKTLLFQICFLCSKWPFVEEGHLLSECPTCGTEVRAGSGPYSGWHFQKSCFAPSEHQCFIYTIWWT